MNLLVKIYFMEKVEFKYNRLQINAGIFLLTGSLPVLFSCTQQLQEKQNVRPNIILIMADDMGYSDIGAFGSEIKTPNLDMLADNGIRFTNFYNAARCCPTRASLLTGLYPHEAGMGGMVSSVNSEPEPGPYQGYLNDNCVTMAEVLREAGYNTYMTGKWHVGEKPEHWPRKRGFEKYFGLISGASSYFELIEQPSFVRQMAIDDEPFVPSSPDFYMTDAFTGYGVQYINDHFREGNQNPMFMYVAYTAPHWPLHALPEDIKKYENRYNDGWDALWNERYQRMKGMGLIDDSYVEIERPESIPAWENTEDREQWSRKMEVYAAMIDRMDQGIGSLVQALRENGQLENTLIIFLSDNGGCAENIAGRNLNDPTVPIGAKGSYVAYDEPWAYASNTPFRKYKQWVHEGGIATPFIAHWPEQIKTKGHTSSQVAHIIDLMPTLLEVSGAGYPEEFNGNKIKTLEGESLLPAFHNPEVNEPRVLYWEHMQNRGIRVSDWKLLAGKPEPEWELYNLVSDPVESNNLLSQFPEKADSMITLYNKWAEDVGVR